MSELSLAEAVARSLSAVESPPDVVEDEDTHKHVWGDELVCRGCGQNEGVTYEYRETGTAYANVYSSRYGLEIDEYDSNTYERDRDGDYKCQNCSETDADLDTLFVPESAYHAEHDCDSEGCSGCQTAGCY